MSRRNRYQEAQERAAAERKQALKEHTRAVKGVMYALIDAVDAAVGDDERLASIESGRLPECPASLRGYGLKEIVGSELVAKYDAAKAKVTAAAKRLKAQALVEDRSPLEACRAVFGYGFDDSSRELVLRAMAQEVFDALVTPVVNRDVSYEESDLRRFLMGGWDGFSLASVVRRYGVELDMSAWQRWVAENFRNPGPAILGINPEEMMDPGDLPQQAAAALREDDIVGAKIVLAYVYNNDGLRAEVGELATWELCKLADRLNADRRLND